MPDAVRLNTKVNSGINLKSDYRLEVELPASWYTNKKKGRLVNLLNNWSGSLVV